MPKTDYETLRWIFLDCFFRHCKFLGKEIIRFCREGFLVKQVDIFRCIEKQNNKSILDQTIQYACSFKLMVTSNLTRDDLLCSRTLVARVDARPIVLTLVYKMSRRRKSLQENIFLMPKNDS